MIRVVWWWRSGEQVRHRVNLGEARAVCGELIPDGAKVLGVSDPLAKGKLGCEICTLAGRDPGVLAREIAIMRKGAALSSPDEQIATLRALHQADLAELRRTIEAKDKLLVEAAEAAARAKTRAKATRTELTNEKARREFFESTAAGFERRVNALSEEVAELKRRLEERDRLDLSRRRAVA